MWGCVVVPELQSYFVPNGASPQNAVVSGAIANPGIPIAGPIYRAIKRLSVRWEAGAVTGGRLSLYELCLDGNWHLASAQTASSGMVTASQAMYHWFGPGTIYNSTGTNIWTAPSGVPFLGAAVMFAPGAGLAGANINYLEVKAMVDAIDAGFVFGAKLGALAT